MREALANSVLPLDAIREDMIEAMAAERIVVAFRNARVFHGDIEHTGRSPVWYTKR